ncbi:hypothetical protein AD947_13825 [Acetobacter tropicalis]|uniref:Uncharacterized protein n=1 Tax=Acetobacter tropicalis TaxID=104102 RepID=A0A149TRU2_9PROT|nr:hypothetical protein AD947_13825 [Acetobacter tropicalis]
MLTYPPEWASSGPQNILEPVHRFIEQKAAVGSSRLRTFTRSGVARQESRRNPAHVGTPKTMWHQPVTLEKAPGCMGIPCAEVLFFRQPERV